MVARAVDETKLINQEVAIPGIEIVHFTTQSIEGDWYDSKKFGRLKGAFASNLTSDAKEIQLVMSVKANGQPRITLTPSENTTEGYLLIFGSK